MKLITIFFTSVVAVALSTLAPTSTAAPVKYVATLSNVGEPPAAASSLGTGNATVFLDLAVHTLEVHVSFNNLSGNTTVSHIHCCTGIAGTGNAGVATEVPSFPGFPSGVTAGTYIETFALNDAGSFNPAFIMNNGGSVAGAEAALAAGLDAGKAYVNIHSSLSPGGEIRGFLTRVVPEPQNVALMLFGIGAVGWMRRRKRST